MKTKKNIFIFLVLLSNLFLFAQADANFSRRVLCGGSVPYTDSHGYTWEADQAYPPPGGWGYTTSASNFSSFAGYHMENTNDWPLYQNEIWGSLPNKPAYQFDLPGPGKYYVKILLAEMHFGVAIKQGIGNGIGQRVFDLYINGVKKLDHYDNLADTNGRAARAVVKSFEIEVSDSGDYANTIIITTQVQVENPKINAIEISDVPTLTDAMEAYSKCSPSDEEVFRLNCAGIKSIDPDNTLWMADEAYALCQRWGYVSGIPRVNTYTAWADPEGYRHATWRAGGTDFKYVFTLPNGQYNVKLIFVENEFNASGLRVFDVSLNGTSVAVEMDVYALVGSETPFELNAPVIVSDEQLQIAFPAIQFGEAMISAIEIKVSSVDDNAFLDFVERRGLDYFINTSAPFCTVNNANGMVVDRMNNYASKSWGAASMAAVGFGLAAICAGKERNWISFTAAEQQITAALNFLYNAAPYIDGSETGITHKNGFFYHFVRMDNGRRFNNYSELSSIDSALLFAGALTASRTFGGQIETLATAILERANWTWFTNGDENSFVAMAWKPETSQFDWQWNGYNEGVLVDLLGMASAAYPLSPKCWFNMNRVWMDQGGIKYVTEGDFLALFTHIYAQCFVDLRSAYDDKNNYFLNTQLAIQADREFCQANAGQFRTYAEEGWGLTAGDSPVDGFSYQAYRNKDNEHDGTVNPSIVGASIPFAPEIAVPALRRMYFQYKHFLWGRFGFADSYNLDAPMTLDRNAPSGQGWVSSDVIGIDLGSMILAMDNYRTGNVWSKFTQHTSIQAALTEMGINNPVIDDFENDRSFQDADNARDAQWWAPKNEVYLFSPMTGVGGNTTTCLRVVYNKGSAETWDYMALGNLGQNANMSYYLGHDELGFQVYGRVDLVLKFMDINGNESGVSNKMEITSPNAWQSVLWNYSTLNWQDCDPRHIQDILIFVQPGEQGSGEFFIDDVRLEKPASIPETITPVPTPFLESLVKNNEVFTYPNPGRDYVNLLYWVSGEAMVYIDIYNIGGERIAGIREQKDGGNGQVMKSTWVSAGVGPGIYFCRIKIDNAKGEKKNLAIKKIALVR